jgi:cyclohexadieny/prephenate dehydrogenase
MSVLPIKRVAIIGIGLIGSSIARGAAERLGCTVTLYDHDDAVRARAAEIGLGTVTETADEAVKDADLVVLSVPVGVMGAAARSIAGALKQGAIVTDTGSVKAAVVTAAAKEIPAHAFFVPGHPIAGTEFSGPDAGFAALFEKRWLILTPLDDLRPEYARAVAALEAFWTGLGANVEHMRPDRHDMVLAVTSHLPHLIAFNIVITAENLQNVKEAEVVKYSASGFRDFTRIAASDPTMWRDVFLNNREAVLDVLGHFIDELHILQKAIRYGDGPGLFETITRARRVRREVIDAGQDIGAPNFGRK